MSDLVLYRFFDESGDLLYVGKSMNVWNRFTVHRRGSRFYPEAATVTLDASFKTIDELLDAEVAAIRDECPRFNVLHNADGISLRRVVRVVDSLVAFSEVHPEQIPALAEVVAAVADSMGRLAVERREDRLREIRESKTASLESRKRHGLPTGRPRVLSVEKVRQARALRDSGEPMDRITVTLGVSRATLYRTLAAEDGKGER